MGAATEALAERAARLHSTALALVARVDDERLRTRLGPTAPPPGFHLWHMARWADRLQSRVTGAVPHLGPTQPEIWAQERLADAWRVGVPLGTFDSGMEIGDDVATKLVLPEKDALLDYAARAFAAAGRCFDGVHDDDLERRGKDLYDREGTVATMLVGHLQHLNRHLGMIEALIGVMGESGTASV